MTDYVPSDPISEWDLALFAENALDPIRYQEVADFLGRYPDVAMIAGIELPESMGLRNAGNQDNAVSSHGHPHDTSSSLPQPNASNTRRPSTSPMSSKSPPATRRFRSRLNRFTGAVNVLAAAVFVCVGIAFIARARAAAPVLQQIKQNYRDGSLDSDSNALVKARIKLEEIDPLFLTSKDKQLRQYLLAMVLIGQAENDLLTKRTRIASVDTLSEPPLADLTDQAISSLTDLLSTRPEFLPDLARAWALHGRIHLRFMVSYRGKHSIDAVSVARAFLHAFELMPEENPERWRVASRLLKTLYKVFPAETNNQTGKFLQEIERKFPEIPANVDRSRLSVVIELARAILRQPPDARPIQIAHLEVASILTMARRMKTFKGIDVLDVAGKAVVMAEAHLEGANSAYRLVYGQLLGNLADLSQFDDLSLARERGWQAHEVLSQLAEEERTDEVLTELGWVTARLLLNEYRYSQKQPNKPSRVGYLVGALQQTESSLKHFEALQLTAWEIDVIKAIYAEDSGDLSDASGAEQILKCYREKQLSNDVLDCLHNELANLTAFQDNAEFQTFLQLSKAHR